MPKDAVIVLSYHLTPERELTEELRSRVDKGLEILANGEVNFIVMNGGPGIFSERTEQGLYLNRGTHPVQSEAMAQYAMQRGVPREKIAIQDFSSDTVGESYFVKEMVLLPNRLLDNIVVSSDYHIPRVIEIYTKILGERFLTSYVGVPIVLDNAQETEEYEKESLEIFRGQFGQVIDGDSAAIEEILYSEHTKYNGISEELKWMRGISPIKSVGELSDFIDFLKSSKPI